LQLEIKGEKVVSKKAPFEVVITDDNKVAVDLSDAFVVLSAEEQLKIVKAFFWEKTLKPYNTLDVSSDAIKEEITIVLADCLMAQLKRGEPLKRGGQIDVNFEVLENLGNILT